MDAPPHHHLFAIGRHRRGSGLLRHATNYTLSIYRAQE